MTRHWLELVNQWLEVTRPFLWLDYDSTRLSHDSTLTRQNSRWLWLDSDSKGSWLWLDKNGSGTSLLCGYWVLKLISRSVTRWLSLYRSWPRMLQLLPASNSYLMSIDKPAVVLKRFLEILWANFVHIKTFAVICGCFYWANSEYKKSKASVVEVVSCFATVKARIQEKQSDVHIKLNQH